ncbi:MAG TPA: LysR family transcriptional regulator [Candidatus Acidoferrum sp.]|nr:LysR family transcriptional regulator [Candidatus Acidoferrum sp.]
MTDLNSLMIFAKVVEVKSFSEAARLLKMPGSTVSRRVADLEEELGVRLIERSTRSLRLTDVGSEVFEQAKHSSEISEAVDNIASNHLSTVSGELRLASPPSISDSFLAPLIGAFQTAHPNIRIQVFITDRIVDQIAEGVDLAFRVDPKLKDSSLVARKILTYRHQLVASPAYLARCKPPQNPQDLLQHRLLAFSFWKPVNVWTFVNGNKRQTLTFHPHLSMNDYAGLAAALLSGTGIGDLPPLVQPELLREGKLTEVMPKWHFSIFHLWIVHLQNRYLTRAVRVFKEFAAKMAPTMFPALPT